MRIKYLPELNFELDTGAETAQRVEELIRQIHEQDEDH
jgi:ribosome-binding factor A